MKWYEHIHVHFASALVYIDTRAYALLYKSYVRMNMHWSTHTVYVHKRLVCTQAHMDMYRVEIHIYTCTSTSTHTHIPIQKHRHIRIHTSPPTHTQAPMHTYKPIHAYIHTFACTCIGLYVYLYPSICACSATNFDEDFTLDTAKCHLHGDRFSALTCCWTSG